MLICIFRRICIVHTTKTALTKKYINIHGALLPKYRGMHPKFQAIINGEKI